MSVMKWEGILCHFMKESVAYAGMWYKTILWFNALVLKGSDWLTKCLLLVYNINFSFWKINKSRKKTLLQKSLNYKTLQVIQIKNILIFCIVNCECFTELKPIFCFHHLIYYMKFYGIMTSNLSYSFLNITSI